MKDDNVTNDVKNLTKTFKLRSEAITLYSFLVFYAEKNNIRKHMLFTEILKFMFNYFQDKDFNILIADLKEKKVSEGSAVSYGNHKVKEIRVPKGFTISPENLKLLDQFHKYRTSIKYAELVEAAIGLYAVEHLEPAFLNYFDIYSWFRFVD